MKLSDLFKLPDIPFVGGFVVLALAPRTLSLDVAGVGLIAVGLALYLREDVRQARNEREERMARLSRMEGHDD
ncbi:hypothetical protein [Haloferax sp. Atlit-6N]|uniref:hypothetical protein n=1 Tax=Haloferax sp. Atlit-6N TaxID=2077205 RepID=UPI0011C02734|nr:hypothetical protein [Haloferax sp. Atlit-6N]